MSDYMSGSLAGAGVSAAGGLLSSTIGAITNSINNKRNIQAQKEINETNIKAAKEQLQMQRDWAVEDRDYNSTESQYARYLAIGLSPAAARNAVNGGSSNLGSIDTSLPQQEAYMTNPSDWSGIGTGAAAAGQIISQAGIQKSQQAHDEKMLKKQQDYEETRFQREMINENYSRAERDAAAPKVSEFWKSLNIEAQNAGFNLADSSREDVVHWLMSENSAMLDRYNTLIGDACADAMLDVKFSNMQNSNRQALENQSIISQTSLNRVQESLSKVNEKMVREQLKYYPELIKAELQLKSIQSTLTSEQVNELIWSNAFQEASWEERLSLLGIDVDTRQFEKEFRKYELDYRKKYDGQKNAQSWTQIVLQGLGTAIGIGTSLYTAGAAGKIAGGVKGLGSVMDSKKAYQLQKEMKGYSNSPYSYTY